jgi:hypothetical protein
MAKSSKATPRFPERAQIRDRIVELRRVKASELRPNGRNWRTHPKHQREAFRDLVREVGFAGAQLTYHSQRNGGALTLIDGHMRQEELGDAEIPCLITDSDDDEADLLILTFDPIGAMAGADEHRLEALLRDVQTGSEPLGKMLERLAHDNGIVGALSGEQAEAPEPQIDRAAELQKKWGTEPGQLWTIASKTVPPVKVVKCPHCNCEQEIE